MRLLTVERSIKNETLGIKSKEKFEVPQAEDFDGAVSFLGGPEQALSVLNQYFAQRAPAGALVALGNVKTKEEFDKDLGEAKENIKKWTPQVSGGPSKNAVFEGFTNLDDFRKKYPQVWSQLTLDEGLAVIMGKTSIEDTLKAKGVDLSTIQAAA